MSFPPRRVRAALAPLVALAMASPALPVRAQTDPLPPGQIDVQLSIDQSTGRYREPTATRIRTAVLTGRYRRGPWLAELQLPWVQVRSRAAGGGLPDNAGGPHTGDTTVQGQGDALAQLGLELREVDAERTGLDLVVKFKARNGSRELGLGTGGTDVSVQLEALRRVGRGNAFGHLGHRRTGDVPGQRPYRNPWYGELGWSHPLANGSEAGAFIDLREPLGRLGPLGELTAYTAWRDGPRRVQLYVTRGFRPASADWAVGMSVRLRQ